MKILVVGSGGREHAIAWRLAQDAEGHEIFCAPGNAGTAEVATNVDIKADDVAGIVAWSKAERPDLVVVGPEAPLVIGLVDALEKEGIVAFGPVAAGARMEGSKRFAKEVMSAAGVPTGAAEVYTDPVAAKAALAKFGLPVVIKADGLAAGKGVVVAETTADAESAIDDMLVGNKFGSAGAEVLIEEFLDGEECSILALVDGKTEDLLPEIKSRIIMPVVNELKKRGIVYRGILYAGLMVTPEGGKLARSGSRVTVVEFNARFGDPETEAVLPRLGGSFATALLHAAKGCLKPEDVVVNPGAAATVIIASGGYPGSYEKGKAICGLGTGNGLPAEALAKAGEPGMGNAIVFHCGTKAFGGAVVTSGGRVLSVTGCGATLREAVDRAYAGVAKISFEGMFYRKDIAHRAFGR